MAASKKEKFEAGRICEVEYPFVITRTYFTDTGKGGELTHKEGQSWRPGCYQRGDQDGNEDAFAEGVGYSLLTVISTHKPGKYPERVFYTRQWKDPDGKVFGKTSLKITTTGNFRRMLNGYRYDYELEPKEVTADNIYEEKIPF